MASSREIRELIAQTTTGTHRRRLPREVRDEVRRHAKTRRANRPDQGRVQPLARFFHPVA